MGKASKHAAVWLVRVGPTSWEEEGRLAGSADLPLGVSGLAAAKDRARLLKGHAISAILCGPDEASMATAQIVADSTGAAVKVQAGLAEVGLGLWEGLRATELEERSPSMYRQWRQDPADVRVPGGEAIEIARARMIEVYRKAVPKLATVHETVIVALRPMALGLTRCWLEGRQTSELWDLATGGAGVERLTLDCDRLRERLGLAVVRTSA